MNISSGIPQIKSMVPPRLDALSEFDGRFIKLSGKKAVTKKWQKNGLSIEEAQAHLAQGGNVGIHIPDGWIALDFDPRNAGIDPDKLLEKFCTKFDFNPFRHFEVSTGGGGKHWYMRTPPNVSSFKNGLDGFDGFNIQTPRKYCVAPGSIHPETGKQYRISNNVTLTDSGMISDKLLAALVRTEKLKPNQRPGQYSPEQLAHALSGLDPANFRNHEAAKSDPAWLTIMQSCHHATNGGGREEFISWSISDPKYHDHAENIGQRWDSLCDKPNGVTVDYLKQQLHRAVQSDKIPGETLTDAFDDLNDDDLIDVQPAKPNDLPQPHHKFVTNRKRARYLLDNMIPAQGVVNVFGRPGDGKSTWVYSLAWALAEGRKDFMGMRLRGNGPMPVLYLPFEGRALLDEHHIAHATHFGTRPDELLLPRTDYDLRTRDADGWKKLDKHIKALGVKAIIIDTLSQAIGGEDENGSGAVGFLSALNKLANDNDLCAIFLHHPTKANPRDARGSGALTGNVDNQLLISNRNTIEIQKDKLRGVSGVKHQFSTKVVTVPDGIDQDGEELFVQGVVVTGGAMPENDADADKFSKTYDALAAWMISLNEDAGLSPSEILKNARAFGMSPTNVRDAVYHPDLDGGVLTSSDCVLQAVSGQRGGKKIICFGI